MHKKAILLLALGGSVAALAAGTVGPVKLAAPQTRVKVSPAAVRPIAAAVQYMPAPSSAIASSVARWNSLRQSDNHSFATYASFMIGHRGWPGEMAMRRNAERQLDPTRDNPSQIVAFFNAFPPLTPTGHARYAFALQSLGRTGEAQQAARTAWTSGALPALDEQRLLGAFGSGFTPQDHDLRMEALLSNRDTQSAARTLSWASAARRPLYEARLALQSGQSDAASRIASLGAYGDSDPGLLMDRATSLRARGDSFGARQLLASPRRLAGYPANPAKYMETLVTMARAAANDRQWALAYQIASQVDPIYPAGTNVREKSFDERDEYTNLTWLAGTTAHQQLNRHNEAAAMFERYARASQSPQSQTKGLYWAARAAAAAGQVDRSLVLLREAARHYDQYYGQLAAERLGQPLPAPTEPAIPPLTAADRQAFNNRPLVAALRYLGQTGNWRDQTQFVRALAEQAKSDPDRIMAVQVGQEVGRPDLGVLIARSARTDGSFNYKRWGFPQVQVPPAQQQHWTLVHAIARQESLFDRQALSSAGARGLMQLMPGTAREVAGQLGVGYDASRLTDPSYNVMLGSTYFGRLLSQWGGSYPLAVASYNAGPGNVRKWVRENGDPRLPGVNMVDWIEKIPFFETRNYVQRVLENAVVYDLMNPARSRSPANSRLSYYLGGRQSA